MRTTSVGRLTLGVVLAVLGVALLLDMNFGQNALSIVVRYWPAALILLGLEYVLASRDPENRTKVSAGSIVLLAVALCLAWMYVEAPVSFWGFHNFGFSFPGQAQYTVELPVSEAFGTASTRLSVEAIHDVTITGAAGNAVTGTAEVTVRARSVSEARQVAEQLRVTARPSGSTLYLEVSRPDSLSRFVSIQPSFTISMPSTGSLSVRTVSGRTHIVGVTGDVSINSVSGGVSLDEMPASVDADLISGSLTMTLNQDMEFADINTVSGSVSIDAPDGTGGTVDFGSVSGSVDTSFSGIQETSKPGRRTATGEFGTGTTRIKVNSVSGSLSIN